MKETIEIWEDPSPIIVPSELIDLFPGRKYLASALINRGIFTQKSARSFLSPSDYSPSPPDSFLDMERAVELICNVIKKKEVIGIWGDFDVDGQTSTTILVSVIRSLGGMVRYHIPIRGPESHGIGLSHLETFLDSDIHLLLTCDTGITAHEAVDYSQSLGIPVIITDHHTLPEVLPNASAILNSQCLPSEHPLYFLSGAGVAYKLAEALLIAKGMQNHIPELLDLVTLGTIADVALLQRDNRFLVSKGLEILRHGPRLGLKMMMEIGNLKAEVINEDHIAYFFAPRLNAMGRLGNANPIIEFLLSTDPQLTRLQAIQLEQWNGQRKLLCDQVFQAAAQMLESDPTLKSDPFILLSHPLWPAGVNGIVASRLVELYQKPVLILNSEPNGISRGSARSIEGINITQAIATCHDVLLSYGGHSMAAGFSLYTSILPQFKQKLIARFQEFIPEQIPHKVISPDAYLFFSEIDRELAQEIDRFSPFGAGNPPLLFATKNVSLESKKYLDRAHEHLDCIVRDKNGMRKRIIWWQGAGMSQPDGLFDLAYVIRSDSVGEPDLEWVSWHSSETGKISLEIKPGVKIQDLRYQESEPVFRQYLNDPDCVVWNEDSPHNQYPGVNRTKMHPAKRLIIAFPPPGKKEIEEVCKAVTPEEIIVIASPVPNQKSNSLLTQLAGFIKYAISNYQGNFSISTAAALSGQRNATVQIALQILTTTGKFRIVNFSETGFQFAANDMPVAISENLEVRQSLDFLLKETQAFQKAFMTQDLSAFFNIE